jgi:hypothetical protein
MYMDGAGRSSADFSLPKAKSHACRRVCWDIFFFSCEVPHAMFAMAGMVGISRPIMKAPAKQRLAPEPTMKHPSSF